MKQEAFNTFNASEFTLFMVGIFGKRSVRVDSWGNSVLLITYRGTVYFWRKL